ncbi:hypothetical protein [Oceaniglobus roseus]|uniref:hypothetical protein n=1 Tax=Oceaniglobus roseus TaxID=1737570 RepID=UPI00130004F1|nr:hypothetical protein [Kandeliimicrobium roseum]
MRGLPPQAAAARGLRPGAPGRPLRRAALRMARWLFRLSVVAVLLAVLTLALTDRPMRLPDWITGRIEARLNEGLARGAVDLGGISLRVDRGGVPRLTLLDVALTNADGTDIAQLDRVRVAFDPAALLERKLAPRALELDGANVVLRRGPDGGFLLSFGGEPRAFPGIGAILAALEEAFGEGALSRLARVEVDGLDVTLEDARSARVWSVSGGRLGLRRSDEGLDVAPNAEVFNGTDERAFLQLSLRSTRDGSGAAVTANVQNVAARDIAAQAPVLAFLEVLDAPISGAFRARLDRDGALEDLAGTLEFGRGKVQPRPETEPLNFDSAKTYFTYRAAEKKISFSQISVESEALSAALSGHAYLRSPDARGRPSALVAQMQLERLELAPLGLFEGPLAFEAGAADVRMRLSPFGLDIGQVVLREAGEDAEAPPRSYVARGRADATPRGWDVAVDLTAEAVPARRPPALWPLPGAEKTREWLDRNVAAGRLLGLAGGIRKPPGEKPKLAATFSYEGAEVSFLPGLPPVTGAAGFASVGDDRFALVVDRGQVTPPVGGPLDLSGTRMVVPDTKRKPARGEFTIAADGSATALLSLLDSEPLNLLKDSPRGPDMVDAHVAAEARLGLFLQKGNRLEDVDIAASGRLDGLRSDRIVPGRMLAAESLDAEVSGEAVVLSGRATLDGVPLSGRWRLALAGEERGASQVKGQVELSGATVKRLGLGLPEGMVTGRGFGDVTVDLRKGAAPALTLGSDLAGVRLSLDAVGWSKPAGATGRLDLSATLGDTPRVDAIALEAPGLSASGSITLKPGGGGLERARFGRVRLNGWLDAPVTLAGRGSGAAPAVSVEGGSADFRQAVQGLGGSGGGGGGARGPVSVALERLQMTEGIALTGFRLELAAGRATSGAFTARVNGGTPVQGELAGGPRGVTVRLRAADAGGVLRDAGLVKNAHDGPLEVLLVPTGAPGTYDGNLKVGRARIRGAPAVADLLGAISVVGLLEQLNGDGLVFDETRADFRLTPAQLILYRGSAVGASLGISLDGVYDLGSKRVDMQGVISPVYLLNSIGSFLTRRGEGLFGFNFTLKGPAARPDVSVNPLSILTPGMFRELFRRAPPERR